MFGYPALIVLGFLVISFMSVPFPFFFFFNWRVHCGRWGILDFIYLFIYFFLDAIFWRIGLEIQH